MLRLVPETLKLRESGGLQRLSLRYCTPLLQDLQRRIGQTAEVEIFADRQDVSYVVVANPFSNQLFKVPCSEQPMLYEGITEYQQKLILKLARLRGITNPSLSDLVAAREELHLLTQQLSVSKKMRSRKKAEQIGSLPQVVLAPDTEPHALRSEHLNVNLKVSPVQVITELEWEIEQLENSIADDDFEKWGQL